MDSTAPYTLYIGGGTPSLMPPEYIAGIKEMTGDAPVEFTIEVNPDDVEQSRVEAWAAAGVDRISMGVQSLVDSELRAVGRRHDAESARRAFETLRSRFDNISLDLMFGLPGQNVESLRSTLGGFLEMRPEHISAYSLMYEERAALTRLRDCGKIEEIPEDESVEMFLLVNETLARNGYERYEISNYSLPGRRSRHNSNYWRGYPYLGLGPSAHSYDGCRRRSCNIPDLRLYLEKAGAEDESEYREEEILGDVELREEMVMTRLRTVEGLDLREFETRFGSEELRRLLRKGSGYISSGMLRREENMLSLTEKGVMVSDDVMSSLF